MAEHPELICAYRLDGKGGGNPLEWYAIGTAGPDGAPTWIHLDALHAGSEAWLREESGLTTFVIDGLLASETRPRCDSFEDGILLILRGVNLNPEAEPEDMVSIRIWMNRDRIVSTRYRKLMAVQDVRDQIAAGKGPVSTGHLAARLAAALTERMGPVIEGLGDEVADLEERLIESEHDSRAGLREVRRKLVDIRRVAISLRRYIAPQREALNRLAQSDEAWLDQRVRGRMRETVDRVTRIVEELDEIRERSAIVQDELMSRLSQRMEHTMYVLTVVAAIMLPLGFLTGLLGINVGGMPGSETSWAFWAVCGGLAVMVVLEIWLFRRLKWL